MGRLEIIKEGITNQGYDIQIENWSKVYDFYNYGSTLAIYKPSKISLEGQFTPKENEISRFSFNFQSQEQTEEAYNNLIEGKTEPKEYKKYLANRKYKDCI